MRVPSALRGAVAALLAAGLVAPSGCAPPASLGAPRPLARVRHDQLPAHLPVAWRQQLEQAAARLPALPLSDPTAAARVRDCLERVSWVDPASIEVAPALPDGIRALYRPRRPRLALARGDAPVAMVAADGVVLPEGFSVEAMRHYLRVPLPRGFEIPPPGARIADPLLQEALFAALEAYALRDRFGLALTRIERRFDFPASAIGVPPALSFLFEDGREICWGWSGRSEQRVAPPEEVRVPPEVKLARIEAALALYPGLAGVSRLVVDRAELRIYGLDGDLLPGPDGL